MAQNELGEEVPENILEKARLEGCMKCPKYVYKDGEYGDRPPVASIGGRTTSRFGSRRSAEKHKVKLGEGWVAFESPSSGETEISSGKGRCEPCVVCGEDRITEGAHFPTPERKGGTETIPLCPTHHRLLDTGRISRGELEEIWKSRYERFDSFEEFMIWANEEGYDYSWEDIKKKKLYDHYEKKLVKYEVKNK